MAAPSKYDSTVLEEIKTLIDARKSCAAIAEELYIPASTIEKIAAREGWKFNSILQAKEARRTLNVDHIWDKVLQAKVK